MEGQEALVDGSATECQSLGACWRNLAFSPGGTLFFSLTVFAQILAEYTRVPIVGTDEGRRGSGGHFPGNYSPPKIEKTRNKEPFFYAPFFVVFDVIS